MKHVVRSIGLACLLMTGSVSAETPAAPAQVLMQAESVLTMRVRGELAFDATGKVIEHHLTTAIEPQVAQGIARAISHWRFRPYLKDGVAVSVRTPFEVTLAGRKAPDGNYNVAVESSRFGVSAARCEPTPGKPCVEKSPITHAPPLPTYPSGMQRAGVGGQVLVYLYINPDGSIADASVAQSALFDARGADAVLEKTRGHLERACLAYARGLKVVPGTGTPAGGDDPRRIAALPFLYHMQDRSVSNLGIWRLEARGPKRLAEWARWYANEAPGVSDVGDGSLLAMRSEYQLLDNADGG